ncbi:MAG TPA: alpha-glucan family phosphorylase [Candidatus Dormibacteraeota bacterium]|nr:alpha-glucan family phosphorylase [Candidatus Dormibacteraeota bacterium]
MPATTAPLDELRELALDLTWTWDPRIQGCFAALDPEGWEKTNHNPVLLLIRLGAEGVERALARAEAAEALERARAASSEHRARALRPPDARAPLLVGYFSLEFGVAEVLPIYSGGLGVLAGDHLKAASDLGLPLVGVGLLYRQGFGRQRIDDQGRQYEVYPESVYEELPLRRVQGRSGPIEVSCPLGADQVRIGVWRAQVGRVPLFLLDTDLESNPPELRSITDRLYVPEPARRLRQEIVLGIGGMRALRAMGVEATVFHMNEGHGFLLAIERMRELRQSRQMTLEEARLIARAGFVFTTHTPVAAGSDYFEPGLVYELLGPYLREVGLSFERFMDLGRRQPGDPREPLCTTYVGLRMADHAVGVSRLHGAVSRHLWKDAWPGLPEAQVPIRSVTNGVHMPTWVAPEVADLLRRFVDRDWWDLSSDDPRWAGVDRIPDEELWACHLRLKRRLTEFVHQRAGRTLDPEILTVGFSRRFALYKRANLLLRDRERLQRLLRDPKRPMQLVFAGKAHPADEGGKAVLRDIVGLAREEPRVVFLEDYDMAMARLLVQGSDVWLNNPRRFLEASGTSGMKAGANGVLNLSVLDGWWDEGYRPDAGWAIPSGATIDHPETDDDAEAEALYRLLEREVVPGFYRRDRGGLPTRWLAMMRASIRHTASQFSARRMLLDYFTDCYAPAARRVEQLRLLPDWGG